MISTSLSIMKIYVDPLQLHFLRYPKYCSYLQGSLGSTFNNASAVNPRQLQGMEKFELIKWSKICPHSFLASPASSFMGVYTSVSVSVS